MTSKKKEKKEEIVEKTIEEKIQDLSLKEEIELFHKYDINFKSSTLYLGSGDEDDEIDWLTSERIIKNLYFLDQFKDKEITLILNSPGGCVYNGLAIYDALRSCKNYIKVVIYGTAMSMASVIVQAADMRVMHPNASMMIHYGTLAHEGSAKEVYSAVEENKRLDKIIEDIYLNRIKHKKPRFGRKKLEKLMDNDCYFSPNQCLRHGLIDKIL